MSGDSSPLLCSALLSSPFSSPLFSSPLLSSTSQSLFRTKARFPLRAPRASIPKASLYTGHGETGTRCLGPFHGQRSLGLQIIFLSNAHTQEIERTWAALSCGPKSSPITGHSNQALSHCSQRRLRPSEAKC